MTEKTGITCDMGMECDGNCPPDEHLACRDPEYELIELCEECLDEGWRAVVEVLE